MPVVKLKCECGAVRGEAESITARSGTWLVCCCDDCQVFATYLKQEDKVLDEFGGTDLFQLPLSYVKITEGNDNIACVRLSEKGLHCWYASCCNTPIGNTLTAGVPFIVLFTNMMDNADTRNQDIGKSKGVVHPKFARQKVPTEQVIPLWKAILRNIGLLTLWKLKGLNKPSSFFDTQGKPVVEPKVL